MIVVDASVAVKWFVSEVDHEAAVALLGSGNRMVAPDIVIAETMHALRRKLRVGDLSEGQYLRAGSELAGTFDQIVSSADIADEATRLSIQLDHGFYDCLYLALAITTGGPLVTADEVFLAKASNAGFGSSVCSLTSETLVRVGGQLKVSIELVNEVGRLASLLHSTFEALAAPHRTGERFQFLSTNIYAPAFESPAYLHLGRLVLGLTVEQRAQLIALGWFGRDRENSDFSQLVDNARQMFAEKPKQDLPYIISVMGTVGRGFEKLSGLNSTSENEE